MLDTLLARVAEKLNLNESFIRGDYQDYQDLKNEEVSSGEEQEDGVCSLCRGTQYIAVCEDQQCIEDNYCIHDSNTLCPECCAGVTP